MSFEAAATVPLAYLTALHALQELGQVQTGRSRSGARGGWRGRDGCGAAVPALWGGGVQHGERGQMAGAAADGTGSAAYRNSRDLGFETQFLSATDGRGVDVVLNALTSQVENASLRLLRRGGRFLEMGIDRARDPRPDRREVPGTCYQAFVLLEGRKPPEQMQALLKQLMGLFEQGVLEALPYVAYDVRQMPAALRQMAQGRHVGKQVVQLPRRLEPAGRC